MSQAPSVSAALSDADRTASAASDKDAVSLRGTTRGLEISIAGSPPLSVLAAQLTELLAEAPGFFAGCDARVAFDGPLPSGALGCLEEVATRFALTIVEVAPMTGRRPQPHVVPTRRSAEPRRPRLADGTGPIPEQRSPRREAARRMPEADGDLRSRSGVTWQSQEVAAGDGAASDGTASALPSLPSGAVASQAVAQAAAADPRAIVADPADAPEAAPIEVALANTAPYEAVMINDSTNDGAAAQPRSVGSPEPRVDVPPSEDTNAAPVVAAPDEPGATASSADAPSTAASAALPSAAIRSALIPGVSLNASAPSLTAQASTPAIAVPPSTGAPAGVAQAPVSLAQASAPAISVSASLPSAPPAPAPRIETPASPPLAADAVASGATAMAVELAAAVPPGARLVVGPVRSGVIVDHAGHVIIIGDVNPGAEVRAEGSIIVLGRLRGVAHAVIGRAAGFIIALSLQPQQLRIGRMVARAGDADRPGSGAEIAYANGETIVVERFMGRLPSGLAASM